MTTRKYSTTEKRIWHKTEFWYLVGCGVVTTLAFTAIVGTWKQYVMLFALKPSDFPDLSHEVVEITPEQIECNEGVCRVIVTSPGEFLLTGEKFRELMETKSKQERSDVVALIAKKAYEAGIDPARALRISFCESSYNHLAKNPKSSAKGLFAFTSGTWKNYCTGDPLVAEDSINCFVKLYKQHPSWWSCKG